MNRIWCVAVVVLAATGPAWGDSLLRHNSTTRETLIAKRADYRAGDIITVIVMEELDSSINSDTNTKKESDVGSQAEASANEFLVGERPNGFTFMKKENLPNWQIEAEKEMKARGQTRRKSKLETTVPCTVTAVLENGNLMIEGNRVVGINREDNRLSVSGVIRPRDITPANTIQSDRIANAQIQLKGRGPLWNNQRRGLITRFLDWVSQY
ncbi:MAG: flagellar basal body L-ring protein FlgH [Candidatus Hydrogenedentes bacterium]|nr:flagellar basal body L-ring protein FlgH [Candidatus Hydrogenedentota bacterium]